jgi:hypothetical protein
VSIPSYPGQRGPSTPITRRGADRSPIVRHAESTGGELALHPAAGVVLGERLARAEGDGGDHVLAAVGVLDTADVTYRWATRSASVMAVTSPSSWNLPVPWLTGVVSTSVAWARSAPTVHCSRGRWLKGS